jgi:hypothetical protein
LLPLVRFLGGQEYDVTEPNLIEHLEKRQRRTWAFDGDNFVCDANGRSVGPYRMRIARIVELLAARAEAEKFCESKNKAKDESFFETVQTGAIMRRVVLKPNADEPLFPTLEWIHANLESDELTVLLHHYQECLRLNGPIVVDLDAEKAEGFAAILAHVEPGAALDELATLTRPGLSLLAVLLSIKIDALKSESRLGREENESLREEIAKLRAELATLGDLRSELEAMTPTETLTKEPAAE